ncbi:GNAT family N-acetyltransferase [Staphylococcus warneri]|uniref:GNAT family N-acetyltransferase n=1 Tax=Staphylococcus warneri TaxID=1292 RepID=UPI000F52ECB1|nr:GNAT family N-acetyltransferase [Staphylococcus warneri]
MKQIREVSIEEVETLQKIAIDTFYETFGPYYTDDNLQKYFDSAFNIETLKKELQEPLSFYYFFTEDDDIVGYTKFNVDDAQTEPHGPDYLEVQRIYFYQSHQGGGRGKKFIDLAVEKAKAYKKSKIWLGVWENNPQAIKFYESRGFVETGHHEFITGDVVDRDITMEKEL